MTRREATTMIGRAAAKGRGRRIDEEVVMVFGKRSLRRRMYGGVMLRGEIHIDLTK